MIRLAVSNIAWKPEYDIRMYHELTELGYEGLEIAPSRLFGQNPYIDLERVRQWAGEIREKFCLTVPSIQSIWYGRNENLFRSAEERETLFQYSLRAMEFAKAVSCRNLVFGCPRNRNRGRFFENDVSISSDFFGKLGKAAINQNVVLGIEANPAIYHTDYLNTTKEVIELIQTCGAEGLGLNLDLGTMLCNHESIEAIREMVPVISHVHISEPGLVPIKKRLEHRQLFECLYQGHYDHFVSIEMGCCDELETVIDIMRYIKEICISAEC